MKKKIKKITVQTLENGYELLFDGMKSQVGYMYFSPQQLLKGFMCHIGLQMTDELSMENIDDFLTAVIQWNDNKKCIKEIDQLNTRLKALKGKRNAIAKKLISERAQHRELLEDVNLLKKSIRHFKDKDLVAQVDNILKGKPHIKSLTMKDLGIEDENDI